MSDFGISRLCADITNGTKGVLSGEFGDDFLKPEGFSRVITGSWFPGTSYRGNDVSKKGQRRGYRDVG